ncbi:MAG: ThuA domain-containing protein [Pseudomonadota bacterium]
MAETEHPAQIDCVLIAAGSYHDIDFARLEIMKLLAEDTNIRVRVFEDYEQLDAIQKADCLITYTSDVVPSQGAQEVLRAWLIAGGRWYALHGTNSILQLREDRLWDAPRCAPLFMDLVGSQFVSHPPIAPYPVTVVQPEHPLVAGIGDFETDDELYHLELHGPLEVLMETECTVESPGFVEGKDAPGKHPICYIKSHGEGAVLYLAIGHARGHHDMKPLIDWWRTEDRGAWKYPEFYELLRRGIRWLKREIA